MLFLQCFNSMKPERKVYYLLIKSFQTFYNFQKINVTIVSTSSVLSPLTWPESEEEEYRF